MPHSEGPYMIARTPIVIACALGFLAGIGGASAAFTARIPLHGLVIAAALCIAAFVVWERGSVYRGPVVAFLIAGVVGVLRFLPLTVDTDARGDIPDRATVAVTGMVSEAIAPDAARYRVAVRHPTVAVPRRTPVTLARPVTVYLNRRVDVRYGDTIEARCAWRAPIRARERLTVAGTCGVPTSAIVRVTARGGGSAAVRLLRYWSAEWRRRFTATLDPRAAGLVNAMLLGDGAGLDAPLLDAFRRTGTIHLLVVSGTHMTMLALAVRVLFGLFLPRAMRAGVTAYVIAALVAMIGFHPSVVRGALLATAILAVPVLGRVVNPRRLLLLLTVGMVVVHPHVLAFDLGFQLSVLATAGILSILPWAERRSRTPWRREMRTVLAASVAATLATAPVLVGAFGSFAVLSPIVNLLALPFAPILMVGGIALLAASAAVPLLVPFLAAMTDAVAATFVGLVTWSARIPGVQGDVGTISPWFALALETLLATAAVRWYRRNGVPIFATELRRHETRDGRR